MDKKFAYKTKYQKENLKRIMYTTVNFNFQSKLTIL